MAEEDRHPRAGRGPRPPSWMVRWDRARRPLLLFGGALVLLALGPALGADDAGALRWSLTVGWVGLLLMIATLWQPARLRRHEAWVTELRPPMDDAGAFDPYAFARCSCGWDGEARPAPEEAFEDAQAHAEVVDPRVDRPYG